MEEGGGSGWRAEIPIVAAVGRIRQKTNQAGTRQILKESWVVRMGLVRPLVIGSDINPQTCRMALHPQYTHILHSAS